MLRNAPAARRNGKLQSNPAEPALGPEASAALRDRLLGELNESCLRRRCCLLGAPVACRKEQTDRSRCPVRRGEPSKQNWRALRRRLQISLRAPGKVHRPRPRRARIQEAEDRSRSKVIDKSALALPEPRRVRDRDHVRYVAKQPCLVCGRQPSDAHHLRFAQSRALGRKVSDEFTVPLCRGHHREVHRCGDEAAWWKKAGLDPTVAGRTCGSKPIRYRRPTSFVC